MTHHSGTHAYTYAYALLPQSGWNARSRDAMRRKYIEREGCEESATLIETYPQAFIAGGWPQVKRCHDAGADLASISEDYAFKLICRAKEKTHHA